MILFKPYHVPLILAGTKTQTRRKGKKRWIIGHVHEAKTSYMAKPFARLKGTAIRQERLGAMTEGDAVAEGYTNRAHFFNVFESIYGDADMEQQVWVLAFECVPAPQAAP